MKLVIFLVLIALFIPASLTAHAEEPSKADELVLPDNEVNALFLENLNRVAVMVGVNTWCKRNQDFVDAKLMVEVLVEGGIESGTISSDQEAKARAMIQRIAVETEEAFASQDEPDCESVPEEMQALKEELKIE